MADLSEAELQNLRHLIGAHETSYKKLNAYSSQAVDPQIKQMFSKAAQDSLKEQYFIMVQTSQKAVKIKEIIEKSHRKKT